MEHPPATVHVHKIWDTAKWLEIFLDWLYLTPENRNKNNKSLETNWLGKSFKFRL